MSNTNDPSFGASRIDNDVNSQSNRNLALDVYDLIKDIKDPEKPQTLEDLKVVYESCVEVQKVAGQDHITITFTPTVPHCSLATLIGLCIRVKLEKSLPEKFKLDIYLKKGTHSTENEINKQINDKERIAAAMENPNLRKIVENCIDEDNGYD
ncbi:predicted protein [Nematostella vectensis]|uniref:MIP18 family-like domain-containing protein n=1 Tax=Nematostella vectensis TaxID=45351 RepID=A7SPP5_NEMVE|nr:predicted protein [Nematostella vectensis]|eukprot:XP_001626406.1 predicted protein [Nematostella vectensis]